MFLTRAQVIELMQPFTPIEHGFTPVGRDAKAPFLKKSAIERRLFRVVPGWSMVDVTHVCTENDAVIAAGALVLEGQRFAALGSGIVQRYKSDGSPVSAYDLARNTAKAFKQADSDLLPRAARLAGVGWYLREIPDQFKSKVGTPEGLREYLKFVAEQLRGWNPDSGSAPKLGSGAATGEDRRIGGQHPQAAPPAAEPELPPDDPGAPYTCREIYMKAQRSRAKFTYTLRCEDGTNVVLYSGDVFRAAGLNPDEWKQDKQVVTFDPPIRVFANVDVNGRWIVDRVELPRVS